MDVEYEGFVQAGGGVDEAVTRRRARGLIYRLEAVEANRVCRRRCACREDAEAGLLSLLRYQDSDIMQ
eukprot:2919224-Amphidinium_carterae.1